MSKKNYDPGETHRPDQAGLHYPAAIGARCGGAGQPKGLQSPAGSVVCRAGRAAPDRSRAKRERRAAGHNPNDHNHYERDAGGIRL